jgi:DNA-directed RNA polymerase specialized sigma24 family protein
VRTPRPTSRRLTTRLTARQRQVLELRLLRGMTFRQIAGYLGLRSPATAYEAFRYATEKARRLYEAMARSGPDVRD